MVAAKIEMVNLRIEITPSSEHPARFMVTFAEAIYSGKSPRAGKCLNASSGPIPATTAARPGSQPCNNG
jgi:hypothetical protein